jgi:PAS domain S-box-containing protein
MKSIATKFLLPVVVLAALFLAVDVSQEYQNTKEETTDLLDRQAAMALAFDLAIRSYVADEIRPAMEERLAPGEFFPETMSTSFVARSIFEKVRRSFPDYIIKFSSDDPRNPANQAGPDELRMIQYFNDHPEAKKWSGQIDLNGRPHMAHFNARRMKDRCLRCHGDPEDAPASLIERYGSTAGFDRPVGEVVALDTVAIPMDKVQAAVMAGALRDIGFMGAGVTLLVVLVALVFRSVVARRLGVMRTHFERIASQPNAAAMQPAEVRGNDEISALAHGFNTMVERVRDAHASLEQRVADQTADLRQANEVLQREVNDRKRAEAALRASEERFRQIAENAQEWIWEVDDQGLYTYASPAVTNMLGYSPGELVGKKHFYDMFHPDDREELKKAAFEAFARKEPFLEFVNRNVRKDGTITWLSTSGVPVLDERGRLCGYRGADRDITDRRQWEEVLEAERQQFSSMFDGMEEAVNVSDPETYELLYMNGASREQWGDHVGEKCYRVLQNRDAPCPFCTNDRIFGANTGRPHIWEFQNTINRRWYRCFDRAIRWSDGRMVRFEMAIDIHERKQAEEELNRRVQEVSEAKHRLEVLVSSTTEREQRMVDLKQEVNDLLQALGREEKYQTPRKVAEVSAGTGGDSG